MATILPIIEELCEQVRGAEVNTPAPRFVRQHIFHAILSYCSQGESLENRLDMMFRFDQFEKCVSSIKRRELLQTQHWLDAIHRTELQLATDLARIGMDSLYYPAVALKDYFDGNHEVALERLDVSLDQFDMLFAHGFGEAIFGMVEQNLNKVRVLVAVKRQQEAINETLELFDFLCAERGGPTYKHEKLAAHCDVSAQDSLVAHYIDELLIKFLGTGDAVLVGFLLLGLYDRCGSWVPGNVKNAVRLLQHLFTGSAWPGCAAPDDFSIDLRRLPFSLQFLLVSALIARSGCDSNDQRVRTLEHFLSLSPAYKRLERVRSGVCAIVAAPGVHPAPPIRLSRALASTIPSTEFETTTEISGLRPHRQETPA